MFVEGTLRWQVTEDCPWDLLMALALRDLGGLADVGAPALPLVAPTVDCALSPSGGTLPRRTDTPVVTDRAVVAEQWTAWWTTIVRRELRPLLTGLRPPHFAEFDRTIELQDLIIARFDAALAWTTARHEEYTRTSEALHVSRAADIVDVVREREHQLRRQAGYFRLDISVLPLADAGAWIVGPNSVVVSQRLRDDSAAFREWFAPLVEALV